MKIALVSTLASPVSRHGSHSVEYLVAALAGELSAGGDEVTVFASAGSTVEGELVATLPGPYSTNGSPDDWQICEWINLCRAMEQSARFDVVHSHSYLNALPMAGVSAAPVVSTIHVVPPHDVGRLARLYPDAHVTAVSRYHRSLLEGFDPWVVPNGVPIDDFPFVERPDRYVCYLGRFLDTKGPLAAIEAARSAGAPLVLAGARNAYFNATIAPHVDDQSVRYAGFVAGGERARLLGDAWALLFPASMPEPFGLVMIEAMMCGTPVVALRSGAVPEIVEDGLTGYVVNAHEELAGALMRAATLDRRAIRARAEQQFSSRRMAREYREVYQQVLAGSRRGMTTR